MALPLLDYSHIWFMQRVDPNSWEFRRRAPVAFVRLFSFQ
jgi:hypothetical protein